MLCAMLCYAMLCYAMLCYAMLCYAMLCYAMLCYAMLCYAMLCYAMLCYAMLCYAMPCHAMLRRASHAEPCCAQLHCDAQHGETKGTAGANPARASGQWQPSPNRKRYKEFLLQSPHSLFVRVAQQMEPKRPHQESLPPCRRYPFAPPSSCANTLTLVRDSEAKAKSHFSTLDALQQVANWHQCNKLFCHI